MCLLTRFAPALAGLAATVALVPSSAGAETYWDELQWQVRPLVLVEGGTHADREADREAGHDADQGANYWVERLQADRCALAERRIHWLVIDADGAVWRRFDGSDGSGFEATRLDGAAAAVVRDRLGWSRGDPTRLVLFGLDGQEKYRGRPAALQTIWSLIDRMPMRRAELAREPDNCGRR